MENYNYFSGFGHEIETLMGTGRYLLFHTMRGTLPRNGVQEKMNNLFRGWCQKHPIITRAFYAGTRIEPRNIWDVTQRRIFNLGSPVPICYTSGKQLTSLNGSGQPLRWIELCMYVSIAKDFKNMLTKGL